MEGMGPWDLPATLSALIVAGGLGLAVRWVFRPSRPNSARLLDAAQSEELGLLSVVAAGVSRADALRDRSLLAEAGIRTSLSRRADGALDVLVFAEDLDRAVGLLERG